MGRRLVETLAEKFKGKWKKAPLLHSQWAELDLSGVLGVAAFPELFMNESGIAVGALAAHFKIDFQSELLVVVDDAALPLGRLRLRPSGRDGGHRGLRSIEKSLESRNYARLRIGIAPAKLVEEPLEKYVLRSFRTEEERRLAEIFTRGIESCQLWASGPLSRAMDWSNKPLPS